MLDLISSIMEKKEELQASKLSKVPVSLSSHPYALLLSPLCTPNDRISSYVASTAARCRTEEENRKTRLQATSISTFTSSFSRLESKARSLTA